MQPCTEFLAGERKLGSIADIYRRRHRRQQCCYRPTCVHGHTRNSRICSFPPHYRDLRFQAPRHRKSDWFPPMARQQSQVEMCDAHAPPKPKGEYVKKSISPIRIEVAKPGRESRSVSGAFSEPTLLFTHFRTVDLGRMWSPFEEANSKVHLWSTWLLG